MVSLANRCWLIFKAFWYFEECINFGPRRIKEGWAVATARGKDTKDKSFGVHDHDICKYPKLASILLQAQIDNYTDSGRFPVLIKAFNRHHFTHHKFISLEKSRPVTMASGGIEQACITSHIAWEFQCMCILCSVVTYSILPTLRGYLNNLWHKQQVDPQWVNSTIDEYKHDPRLTPHITNTSHHKISFGLWTKFVNIWRIKTPFD